MSALRNGGKCFACGSFVHAGQEVEWIKDSSGKNRFKHPGVCPPRGGEGTSPGSGSSPPSPSSTTPPVSTQGVLSRSWLKAQYTVTRSHGTEPGEFDTAEIQLTEEWDGTIQASDRTMKISELAAKARKLAEEAVRQ